MSKLKEAAEKYIAENKESWADLDGKTSLLKSDVFHAYQAGARWAFEEAARVCEEQRRVNYKDIFPEYSLAKEMGRFLCNLLAKEIRKLSSSSK